MSRLICERCDGPVDPADKYAVVTDPWGGNREIVCECCRENAWDRQQEALAAGEGPPSLIQQQREAWGLK